MPALQFDPIEEARRHWVEQGWDDAAPGMAAVTSIMRVHQLVLSRVDGVLRPFGLTFARYELLMLLQFSRRGSMPMGKVSERLQVHAASVTNAVDRLETQRLVTRVPHPTDGRTTLAAITARGREVALAATDRMNDVFTDLGLDDADAKELFGLLRRVRQLAGDFEVA